MAKDSAIRMLQNCCCRTVALPEGELNPSALIIHYTKSSYYVDWKHNNRNDLEIWSSRYILRQIFRYLLIPTLELILRKHASRWIM